MADVIDLKPPPPSRIDAAVKRLIALKSSGYLPEQMVADIDEVLKAALCWDLYIRNRGNP